MLLQFGIIKSTSLRITKDCSINLCISALNVITQFANYTTSTALNCYLFLPHSIVQSNHFARYCCFPQLDDMTLDTTGRCPTEEDSVWGIQWLAVAAGSTRSARCPGEGNTTELGVAYRRCLAGVPAEWGSVDASECESVAGRAVRMKVERSNVIQHKLYITQELYIMK